MARSTTHSVFQADIATTRAAGYQLHVEHRTQWTDNEGYDHEVVSSHPATFASDQARVPGTKQLPCQFCNELEQAGTLSQLLTGQAEIR